MTHHDGACRCGEVRLRVEGAPLITMACHCTGCQRMTASAFSLSSLYPSDRFAVVAGEPVIGGLHGELRHYFCPRCMSWLFTRPPALPDFVNVRATMLDDAPFYRPFVETFTREKLGWATTGAVRSVDAFPAEEQFPTLLSEFAAWNAAGRSL